MTARTRNVNGQSSALGGNIGDRSAAGALAAALSDASVEVRKRAAWALGNSDLKQAPPQLIALLSDKDPEMRELAAWALYEIEDPSSISALETALAHEPNKELQISYIRALAAVGEKSVDALKGLLESKDPEIRSIAVRALAGGHATGPWPRPWPLRDGAGGRPAARGPWCGGRHEPRPRGTRRRTCPAARPAP